MQKKREAVKEALIAGIMNASDYRVRDMENGTFVPEAQVTTGIKYGRDREPAAQPVRTVQEQLAVVNRAIFNSIDKSLAQDSSQPPAATATAVPAAEPVVTVVKDTNAPAADTSTQTIVAPMDDARRQSAINFAKNTLHIENPDDNFLKFIIDHESDKTPPNKLAELSLKLNQNTVVHEQKDLPTVPSVSHPLERVVG